MRAGRRTSSRASLGVDRKTLRKYTAPAVAAGIDAGRPADGPRRTGAAGGGLVPAVGRHRLRQVSWPEIERAPRLHRRPAQGGGDGGDDPSAAARRARPGRVGGQSCAGGCAANLPEEARRAQVTVLRRRAAAGSSRRRSTTAGWGCGSTRRSGRRRTVWAFVMVLRCSRHLFVRPTLSDGPGARGPPRTWRRSRSSAACPPGWSRTTSRPGSTSPTSTTRRSTGRMPSWPRTTARLVDPARAAKPKDKPQVERPMPYVRDSFWRGREFTSLERDARRGAGLVPRGRRAARVSPAGRRGPGGGVRRGRGARRCAAAGSAVRAGHLVERAGRPGHPRQGRRHALLGALAATSATASTPGPRPRWCSSSTTAQLIKTHPRKDRGQADRPGRLPAGEDRLPHAHPDLVPHAAPPRSAPPASR